MSSLNLKDVTGQWKVGVCVCLPWWPTHQPWCRCALVQCWSVSSVYLSPPSSCCSPSPHHPTYVQKWKWLYVHADHMFCTRGVFTPTQTQSQGSKLPWPIGGRGHRLLCIEPRRWPAASFQSAPETKYLQRCQAVWLNRVHTKYIYSLGFYLKQLTSEAQKY